MCIRVLESVAFIIKFTLQWFASAPADEPVLRGGDVSEDVSDDNLSASQSDGADAILRTSNAHTENKRERNKVCKVFCSCT